jgi:hypothetical protein
MSSHALARFRPILSKDIRRYATRVTQLLEKQNAELVVIRKELQGQREVLQRRNTHNKGKRIKLQGEFVFSTADIHLHQREYLTESQRCSTPPLLSLQPLILGRFVESGHLIRQLSIWFIIRVLNSVKR